MPKFTIDSDNNITVFGSQQQIEASGSEAFANHEELAKLAAKWPGTRLIEIWNSLPGVEPVKRFTSRPVALTRIWKSIQRLKPTADSHRQIESRKKTESSLAGRSSKKAQVISLLRQPAGASLQAIMSVTGWQAHTVRGFISGHLKRQLGCKVTSFQREGERVYAIKR